MSWESLGGVGTGQMPNDKDWILFCQGLVKEYLLLECGKPPEGCELATFWQDHDLGSYPILGFYCEYSTDDTDDYFSACEASVEKFESAVDWNSIKPDCYEAENAENIVECEVNVVVSDKRQKVLNMLDKLTPKSRMAVLKAAMEIKQERKLLNE